MRRLIIFFLALTLLGGIVWFGWQQLNPAVAPPEPSPVVLREQQAFTNLRALIATTDRGEHPRLFTCEPRECHSESWPSSAPAGSVTDGRAWYYYADGALTRHEPGSGDTQPFVKTTNLVAPRAHILSPGGEFLAYFLDNIHDQKNQLSELWLYEAATDTTRLLVEKVSPPDVLTTPRWNSVGNYLWYVADNGSAEAEKIELVVVGVSPTHAQARFTGIPWEKDVMREIAEQGVMDISFTGRSLAYSEPVSNTRSRITVVHDGSPAQSATVQGTIPYVQWLEDGRLIYAVQEDHAFGFWQLRSTVHTFIARREGELVTARADSTGALAVAAVRSSNRERLVALHLPSRTFQDVAALPAAAAGTRILALQQAEAAPPAQSSAAGITATLEDAQLTAFIEQHLAAIANHSAARPIRVITTSQANVVFFDYKIDDAEHRLLLTIRDALNPEWSIRARYEAAEGEWHKTQGGGLPDPAPQRVYEWEEDLKRWILKSGAK